MPVIDTHAHWYPQPFVSLLERERDLILKDNAARLLNL